MSKKFMIVKDGSIQGWFVSLVITAVSIGGFIAGLIWDSVAERFSKIGGTWATIAIAQFTAWLAYKVAQKKLENGSHGIDINKIIEEVKIALKTT